MCVTKKDTRVTTKITAEAHRELTVFKALNGHRTLSEAVLALIAIQNGLKTAKD